MQSRHDIKLGMSIPRLRGGNATTAGRHLFPIKMDTNNR